MELNQMIDISKQFAHTGQQASMQQDNANKTAFALKMMERLPTEPVKTEPVKIPPLGVLAIPN
jgi:hypothetical protein